MDHHGKIAEYYNRTEKDYKTIWHHKLEGPPALHFGYYDEKASKHAVDISSDTVNPDPRIFDFN